jgi:hypothetical protein
VIAVRLSRIALERVVWGREQRLGGEGESEAAWGLRWRGVRRKAGEELEAERGGRRRAKAWLRVVHVWERGEGGVRLVS